MLVKFGRFGFVGFIIYVSINWIADNPSQVDKFRKTVNKTIFDTLD